jgi:hypothetical protein
VRSKRDGRGLYVKSHDRLWNNYDPATDVLVKDVGTDFFKTKVVLLKRWAGVIIPCTGVLFGAQLVLRGL